MSLPAIEATYNFFTNTVENSVCEIEKSISIVNSRIQSAVQDVITTIKESETFVIHLVSLAVSRHVLSGLAKIAGYEVLMHGTSWSNYLSILQNGADPNRGGETTEACEILDINPEHKEKLITTAKGRCFVLKDTELFNIDHIFFSTLGSCLISVFKTNMHATFAYLREYKKLTGLDPSDTAPLWVWIASAVAALFTPKVRYIYSLEEIHGRSGRPAIFQQDPNDDPAYEAFQALPNDRIGLLGLIKHVEHERVFKHIQENPGKVALGVVEVAFGVLLTGTGLGILF